MRWGPEKTSLEPFSEFLAHSPNRLITGFFFLVNAYQLDFKIGYATN